MTHPKVEVQWPELIKGSGGQDSLSKCRRQTRNETINDCKLAHSEWLKKAVPTEEEINNLLAREASLLSGYTVIPQQRFYMISKAIHDLLKERMGG